MQLPAFAAAEAPEEESGRLSVIADHDPSPGVISGEKVSAVRAIGRKLSLYTVGLNCIVVLYKIIMGDNHTNTSFRRASSLKHGIGGIYQPTCFAFPGGRCCGMLAKEVGALEYGQFYVTRGIDEKMRRNLLFQAEVLKGLARYFSNDWGEVCQEDWERNGEAAAGSERILAAYSTCEGKIWIITEWDRSCTTILFPDEY